MVINMISSNTSEFGGSVVRPDKMNPRCPEVAGLSSDTMKETTFESV